MSNPGLNAIYNGGFAAGIQISNQMGLGRRHMRGDGVMDMLKKGHQMLKDKKLVSKGLSGLKDLAEKNGYGRKRKRGGRRK